MAASNRPRLFTAGGGQQIHISATMASRLLTSSAMMVNFWRDLSSRPGIFKSCRAKPPMIGGGF